MKSEKSLQRSMQLNKVLTYFFLILGAVIMIFPFVWMLLTSLKTLAESMQVPQIRYLKTLPMQLPVCPSLICT